MLKTGIRKSNPNQSTRLRRLLNEDVQDALALHITAKRLCPERESKCMKCSKLGHWAKACRSRSEKRVGEVNFSDTQHDNELFLGELVEIFVVQGEAGDSWKAKVTLNG